MTGPKIIAESTPEQPQSRDALMATTATGIRRANNGAWCAVKHGRLIDTFAGLGSKAAAIRAAGTNRVIG